MERYFCVQKRNRRERPRWEEVFKSTSNISVLNVLSNQPYFLHINKNGADVFFPRILYTRFFLDFWSMYIIVCMSAYERNQTAISSQFFSMKTMCFL